MDWEIIKAIFTFRSRNQADFDHPKFLWNDAVKIDERVRQLVVEELDVDISRVTSEAEWYKDLDCSLDVLELFMRCEEEFGVEISDDDSEQYETVGGLISYLQRKLDVEPK